MEQKSVMVSVSFVRGSGKHNQGGRPDLSIKFDSQLRNSAGLSPASPLESLSSGMKDTLLVLYSIMAGVYPWQDGLSSDSHASSELFSPSGARVGYHNLNPLKICLSTKKT